MSGSETFGCPIRGNSLHAYLPSKKSNDTKGLYKKDKRCISHPEVLFEEDLLENDVKNSNVTQTQLPKSSKNQYKGLETFGFSIIKTKSQKIKITSKENAIDPSLSLISTGVSTSDGSITTRAENMQELVLNENIISEAKTERILKYNFCSTPKLSNDPILNTCQDNKLEPITKLSQLNDDDLFQSTNIEVQSKIIANEPFSTDGLEQCSEKLPNSNKGLEHIPFTKTFSPKLLSSNGIINAEIPFATIGETRPVLYQLPSLELIRSQPKLVYTDVLTSTLLPKSMLEIERLFFGLEECCSLNSSRGISSIWCRLSRPIELLTGITVNNFFLQSILYYLPDFISVEPWIVVHEGRRTLSWIIKGAGSIPNDTGKILTSQSFIAERRTSLRIRLLNELYKKYSKSATEVIGYSYILSSKSWPISFSPETLYPNIKSLPRTDLPGYQGYPGIPGNLNNSIIQTIQANPNEITTAISEPFPKSDKSKMTLLERVFTLF